MIGLRTFNIVLLSRGYPVDQVEVEDFDFHGSRLQTRVKLPQVIQAATHEYALHLLPDRFEIAVNSPKATQHRIDALTTAAKLFLEEYTSPRAITAVGHNFIGAFPAHSGDAKTFMTAIAWPEPFAQLFNIDTEPALSLTTRFASPDGSTTAVRLEPSADNPGDVFYDINVNWGDPQASEKLPVRNLIELYPQSAARVSSLLDRVSSYEPTVRGGV